MISINVGAVSRLCWEMTGDSAKKIPAFAPLVICNTIKALSVLLLEYTAFINSDTNESGRFVRGVAHFA